MKYGYLTRLLVALMMPADAITQVNTTRNYRIVLSTYPEQPVTNIPVHMELHIQNIDTDGAAGDLDVKELIVHLQVHEANEPHTSEQNILEIHRDIPHRELLDMRENPNEQPGHYHANYTFNETGAYEVVVQFKGDARDISSSFLWASNLWRLKESRLRQGTAFSG